MAYLKIDFGSKDVCKVAIRLLDKESKTFKSLELHLIDMKDGCITDEKISSRYTGEAKE